MSGHPSQLYGIKRTSKSNGSAPVTASNSNFSNALSSLIAASSSSTSKTGRPRTGKPNKIDLASLQRENKSKSSATTSSTTSNRDLKRGHTSQPLEDDDYKRSKRKMEEKARIYAALKRGDIEDGDERHMVDFDRKWAERHPSSADSDLTSSSDEEGDDDGNFEKVEYTDELGRTRIGSSLDARRAERIKAGLEEQQATARPAQPSQLIYGDTVQHQAFDLDAPAAERMAELAAKRDRELTPPEAMHYDATKEVRTKGTGFFQFSKDEELRQEQMRDLERERDETELQRNEREAQLQARKAKRRQEIEERRKLVSAKRSGARADRFLAELSSEVPPVSAQDTESQIEDKS